MFFGWQDKIAAASLTVSGALPSLPGENLQIIPVARHARVTGTTMTIDADYGASTTWRVFGLGFAGQGFDPTAAATIRIMLSDVAAGGTDVHDTGTVALNFAAGYGQAFHVLASAQSARYARVVLADASLSSIDLGVLVAYGGTGFWEPSKKHDIGRQWRVLDTTTRQRAVRGNLRRRAGRKLRAVECELRFLTRAEALANAFAADLDVGLSGDALVMLDPTNEPTRESVWGPLTELQPLVNTVSVKESKRFTVEQEL